jgi:hypothetical protein
MKKLFFLLAFALCGAFQADAQAAFVEVSKYDSLATSTTLTYDLGLYKKPYLYSVYIQSDSISGANAGTCVLQVANDRAGVRWKTIQTLTIDGAAQQTALWEGTLYARRAKVVFTSPSGTRKTRVRLEAVLKASY